MIGIINFWTVVHVIPKKKVIKNVETIMARFLWKGRDEAQFKNRVS